MKMSEPKPKRISREEYRLHLDECTSILKRSVKDFVEGEAIKPFLEYQHMHDIMFMKGGFANVKPYKWFKEVKENKYFTVGEIQERCKILILWGRFLRYLLCVDYSQKHNVEATYSIEATDRLFGFGESWGIGCVREGKRHITILVDKETATRNAKIGFIFQTINILTITYLELYMKSYVSDKDIFNIVKLANFTLGELEHYQYQNNLFDFVNNRYK